MDQFWGHVQGTGMPEGGSGRQQLLGAAQGHSCDLDALI